MKKISIFVLMFLTISTISAIEFNLDSEYPQGSSILATISGSFQETITEQDIEFFRGHVRVPIDFNLEKIGDNYYLYASLVNKDPNNYSVVINEVEFLEGAKVVEENITRNFTITEEITDFSISKGVVITEDEFSITVQNLQSQRINITSNFLEEKTTELFSGEIAELKFSVEDVPLLEIQNLKLTSRNTSYEIPIYVLGTPKAEAPVQFEFDKEKLNITLDLIGQTERTLYLKNTGEETIFQVKLSLSEDLERFVSLKETEIMNVEPGFLYPVELVILSGELPITDEGQIIARSSGVENYTNITLIFTPGHVPTEEDLEDSTPLTCSELGGAICGSVDLCDGEIRVVGEQNCCFGLCGEAEEDSPVLRIIGWLLLVIVVLGGAWLYFKKYRKAKGPEKGVYKFTKKEPKFTSKTPAKGTPETTRKNPLNLPEEKK